MYSNTLTNDEYINKCQIKRVAGILCKAKQVLKLSTLINLYSSFIYPYLTYCIEAWVEPHKDTPKWYLNNKSEQ